MPRGRPRSLQPDADGLAPCDIVIDNGRIATIGPDGAGRPCALRSRPAASCCRASSTCTPISTRATSGSARRTRTARFIGARMAVMADREANWSAEDVRKRMDFALRCAFAHGTGALRTHIDSYRQADRHLLARCSPRCASSGKAASRCRRSRSSRSTSRSTTRPGSARMVETVARTAACSAGSPSWASRSAPETDAALDKVFEAAKANGLDLDFHVDESDSPHARSLGRIADAALRHKFAGQDRRRPLLLARTRRRCRARRHHREGRGGRHRGRVAADVQHVSAGPAGRPHPALARRRAAARARRRRRHRDGRERQHARSVLRLWRSRLDRGLSRGDAHPALRSFGSSLAEDRRGDAGRSDAAAATAAWRRARLRVSCSRARARINELLSRPQNDRVVLYGGKQVDRTLPDYRELD